MRTDDKAQRARRKLRVLRASKRQAKSVEPVSSLSPALASLLTTARAAYALCAQKTQDPKVAVAATNAAASLASSFGLTSSPRLGDRLRLEWLAAMGDADVRLLDECARLLGDAIGLSGADRADRVRLASAEAFSLAAAVTSEARWHPSVGSVAFLSFAR